MPVQELFLSPFVLALFGLCIGSFLNVVIHRLPLMLERGWKMESADLLGVAHDETPAITLSTPRSRCPSCGHAIPWYENIPVASWLWLRGRCSACRAPISPRYPLDRARHRGAVRPRRLALRRRSRSRSSGASSARCWSRSPASTGTPRCCPTTSPCRCSGPASSWRRSAGRSRWPMPSGARWPATSRSGRSTGLFKLATGKEGMGFGDFKLLAALGAWLGWKMILPIVLARLDHRRGRRHRA